MRSVVQARLDPETAKSLRQMMRRGWTPSRVVREGIRLVAANHDLSPKKRKIIGIGEFDFGVSDLATNKEYMKDFGRDRGSA